MATKTLKAPTAVDAAWNAYHIAFDNARRGDGTWAEAVIARDAVEAAVRATEAK